MLTVSVGRGQGCRSVSHGPQESPQQAVARPETSEVPRPRSPASPKASPRCRGSAVLTPPASVKVLGESMSLGSVLEELMGK